MPGFRSRSQNALPMWLSDDDGNPLGTAGNPVVTSGGAAGSNQVQGTSANGVADDGSNPVKVGGVFRAPTLLTTGQRSDWVFGSYGAAGVQLMAPNSNLPISAVVAADAFSSAGQAALLSNSLNSVFNNTTWDRQRSAPAGDATTGTGLIGAGILGRFTTTQPTYTNGQYGVASINSRGLLMTQITAPGGSALDFVIPSGGSDGAPVSLPVGSFGRQWNGAGWSPVSGDASGTFIGANQFWTESTTALGASATLNGTLRANGGTAAGVGARFSFFAAEAFSDVAGGTLFIDKTVDGGTTYRQVGSIALVANTSVSLKVPISAAGYRARVVNGTGAQAAALVTSAYSLN